MAEAAPRQAIVTGRKACTVVHGHAARLALLRGLDVLAAAVRPTLGPAGRSVMIERPFARPIVSRSGYAIAKHVHLDDPIADMGVRTLREVGWRTADEVGDGTTTAMVLAWAMAQAGIRAAGLGANPRDLQRGFDRACAAGIAALQGLSRPASPTQIAHVGALATHGDREIGTMLAEALGRVGAEGFILVEDGQGQGSALEIREGMHFDKGYVSSHFATDERRTLVEMDDPYILMHLARISDLGAVVPVLNAFATSGKPLLLIAEDVTGEALSTLVVNRIKADFKVAAVLAPGAGTWRKGMLEDIAIATGGQIVGDERGNKLEDLRPEMLGRAKRVRITRDATTIVEGAGDREEIALRARQLRAAIAREQHLSYDREQLQQRLARLVSGIAVIRVGGVTETELKERKERATDAVHAVRAAAAGGIVPGGGAALLMASKALDGLASESDDERAGIAIVRSAMRAPATQIADNAGADGRWAVARQLETTDPNHGFDAARERFGDLLEAGVIDATQVVCCALRNAVSAAARIVTSEAAIAPVEPESAGFQRVTR